MDNQKTLNEKSSGWALIPFLVFIVIYLGAGIILQIAGVDMAFYQFPSVTAMFIAVIVAFAMTPGSMNDRFSCFAKGAANEDIVTMLIIYILAGAFSAVSADMGGRDATVNLGLTLIPAKYMAAGIFIIAAFMGTATGTGMGTIGAIVPIAVGVADKGNLSMLLVVGACVGGAMFGDNLSMISDTTIAATRSQGVEMKDKFRMNFYIALPAAIITIIVLLIAGKPTNPTAISDLTFNWVKVLPYLSVLILALCGMNVFIVLTIGIFFSGIIGICCGDLTVFTFAQSIWTGFTSMNEVFFLTLFCAGMSQLIIANGGFNWLIDKLSRIMKGNKSAQVGTAVLVSLTDLATANNTIAIVLDGPIAKKISREFKVDPRKTASLLDIFSCVFQGLIPYGAQLLSAAALINAYTGVEGGTSTVQLLPYMWYSWILAIVAIIDIFVPFADKLVKKNPWNWEYECPESEVETKKTQSETVAEG